MKKTILILFLQIYGIIYGVNAVDFIKTDNVVYDYKMTLSKLDSSDPNSVITARNELFNMCTKSSSEEAEECFREFVKFYEGTVRKCDRIFYKRKDYRKLLLDIMSATKGSRLFEDPLQKLDDSSIDIRRGFAKDSIMLKELRNYRECGMKLHYGEGDWYLIEDYEFLYSAVNKLGSLEIKEFYLFIKKEQKERLSHDAGIVATWDKVGDKLVRYEKFSKDHPKLKETIEIVDRDKRILLNMYLFGTDNTPAYDVLYSTFSGKIDNKLLKSYERFIEEYPDSEYHSIIKNVTSILKSNNNTVSIALIDYFESIHKSVSNLKEWLEKKF